MPNVAYPDGRDIGEVTDPALLAYYRGEGYLIDGEAQNLTEAPAPPRKRAKKAARKAPAKRAGRKSTTPRKATPAPQVQTAVVTEPPAAPGE